MATYCGEIHAEPPKPAEERCCDHVETRIVAITKGGQVNRNTPDSEPRHEPRSGLDRFRRNRTGRLTLRIAVTVVGTLVVMAGAVLIPFPGPGWAIVIAGMAILAIEYHWARRLLVFTKVQLARWWHWLGRQRWWIRACVGLSGMLLIWALVWWSIKTSFDFDVALWILRFVGLI